MSYAATHEKRIVGGIEWQIELPAAIAAAIAATGAGSIKDMGQVMAQLKSTHAGQMDFSAASQKVKAALLGEG